MHRTRDSHLPCGHTASESKMTEDGARFSRLPTAGLWAVLSSPTGPFRHFAASAMHAAASSA